MNLEPVIELELKNALTVDGWAIMVVKSIGANIKRKSGTGERTVWATLESPHNHELKVAIDQGAEGVVPDGVLPMEAVTDLAYEIIQRLELALDDTEGKSDKGDW